MLTSLAIRDIVLIDRLDLAFEAHLTALTGETGAGKSIILDALGLALGGRAERALLRSGAGQGSVTAGFEPPDGHPSFELLAEQGIPCDGELVVRRLLGADGRSRAFVNDEQVSTQFLRRLAETLVEVHGQHAQRGLMNESGHRDLLDAFGGFGGLVAELRAAYGAWRDAMAREEELARELEGARREEDYLRHRAQELEDLAPEEGEEEELALQRARLVNREKLVSTVDEALAAMAGQGGARDRLGAAERRLERMLQLAPGLLAPGTEAIARALIEINEAEAALEDALRHLDLDAGALERAEARLFALRDAARKHRVPVEALPGLLADTRAMLARIDSSGDALEAARADVRRAREAYGALAQRLSESRAAAARRLARAVMAELPPLKLERARFQVTLDPLGDADWGPSGRERVRFEVATNPGEPFGPLARIASGGELSRFMLALKVVLARLDSAGTLIFDEVDAGIGGATADAVGERLARLAHERQVLVVTHAPQVAARAAHHATVAKEVRGGRTHVTVRRLAAAERPHEIARMLAGAEITEAARAAAASLLEKAGRMESETSA
ncbi:DNA repair protein RecN [Geminicoccaceae bacterium 1502E]|nr:DNA repair protein RecN [Geminicoccaceae bacterium 1502E]